MKKTNLIIISIITLSFLTGILLYPQMPSEMASHWSAQGEVDDYLPKFWGLFLMPLIAGGIYLLSRLIPRIDPLKKNIEKFRSYFDWFIVITISFLFYLYLLTIFWNLGYRFNMGRMLVPALGFLFFYSGVLIENAERNWFIGIRTPWTLSNEEVWHKTHHLAAKMFKASGLIALVGVVVPQFALYFVLIPILASAFYSMVHSYFLYQKITGEQI